MYLVGFMAAGKTTVAKALAQRLDWEAVDIDELIEPRGRQTVAGIFSRQGQANFRAAERHAPRAQIPRRPPGGAAVRRTADGGGCGRAGPGTGRRGGCRWRTSPFS